MASTPPPLPSSFDEDEEFLSENRMQRFVRRLKQEPLIPLGCALTCWALFNASRSMRAGDHARTNVFFRRRIYAQGFTLAAIGAGSIYWNGDRQRRQQWDKIQKEKEQEAKRDRWLRELEYRDQEDKRIAAEAAAKRAANSGSD